MKFKPKNETCGVPDRGFIRATDYNQQDEDKLIARAKNRKVDVTLFMYKAGFEPVKGPQLEIELDEVTEVRIESPETSRNITSDSKFDGSIVDEQPKKRKRRTKAELEAAKGE